MSGRIVTNSFECQRDEDLKRAQTSAVINTVVMITWCVGVVSYYLDILGLKYFFCGCLVVLSFVVLYLEILTNKEFRFEMKKRRKHLCVNKYRVRQEQEEEVKLRNPDSPQEDKKKRGKFHKILFVEV